MNTRGIGRAIMFQGTGSSVGKSLLVAGLCRAGARRGLAVRPFKPQNMSNNAAVTVEGGEIGRAQALQALAAGVPPTVHMNPVLLKPQTDVGAQIVVQGRIWGQAKARAYQQIKPHLLPAVLESFTTLRQEADLVVVEGAGSASEVNLRHNDIANMGFARASNMPVVVIGDIDRGGVIAALVGTHTVLDPEDRAMVAGFIVNRMRGDPSLFDDGMVTIADHTGWRNFGLVPFFDQAHRLPAEDAMDLADRTARRGHSKGRLIRIAVPELPRIANFDDLDPLMSEPEVEVVMVRRGTAIPPCDLVILPGSKATIADLKTVRQEGWDIDILAHVRRGGQVLGLCGGYQMLGQTIADPDGIEGPPGSVSGLGLLAVDTVLTADKKLAEVSGTTCADVLPFTGYEMHIGQTSGPDTDRPVVKLSEGRVDGAATLDGRVCGTYVHGFFTQTEQRVAETESSGQDHASMVDTVLDGLADHVEKHMDVDGLIETAR